MAANKIRTCYTPNGSIWEEHTPCNQAADESHCCGSNDFCLSNGHCLQAEGAFANRIGRGSCTDPSWRSVACPYECSDIQTDGDCALLFASETPDGSFCCDQNFNTETQSCPQSSGKFGTTPFNLSLGRIIWNRTAGSVMENGTLLPSQVQLSEAQTTVTLRPTASTITATGNVTAIAAGIAVPLGVLLIASLAAIRFLLYKLKEAKKQLHKGKLHDDSAGYNAIDSQRMAPQTGVSTPHTALSKYWPGQYIHPPVNEAPVEREVVEAGARMSAQEWGG